MVVPADTEFSRALTRPLEVLQGLAQEQHAGSGSLDELPAPAARKFEAIFGGSRESFDKIPTLNASLAKRAQGQDAAQQLRLVRWRCMIQDTGLGTEMFLKTIPSGASTSSEGSSSSGPTSGYYGAAEMAATSGDSDAPAAAAALQPEDYSNLAERSSLYAVSVPGENAWYAEVWAEGGAPSESGAVGIKSKQPLAEDASAIGAMLKVYDSAMLENLGVTDVVEIVGVLSFAPFPNSDWQSAGSGPSASTSAAEPLLPCVHVIFTQPAPLTVLPPAMRADARAATPEPAGADQREKDRAALVHFLKTACLGDETVAELVLLALVARVRSTRAGVAVGSLSLNICNVPAGDALATSLAEALRQLCPSVVSQSLALSELNDTSRSLYPTSDGESVRAGRLQLPKGTVLLVDESKMGEGELKDAGVRNVRALNSVIANRKLPYAFPYSEFEFDSDVNPIVLSQGKSFLALDAHVPLQPASAGSAGTDAAPSAASLRAWRRSILESRQGDLHVSQATADAIQQEFVAARKGAAAGSEALGQEDLLRRMAIARLYALSHGQSDLSMEHWRRVVALDEECSKRMAALPTRKSA